MTTEIVIVNRGAIALAADSAVTVGRERVWKSAHKLFSLGPTNDIGIMAYGSADYLGIPWETISKLFRNEIGGVVFKELKECEDKFFEFIFSEKFRNKKSERLSLSILFVEELEFVKKHIKYDNKADFRSNILEMASAIGEAAEEHECMDLCMSFAEFKAEWSATIKALAKDIFKEVITNKIRDALVNMLFHVCKSRRESSYSTGIVFAGFGSENLFPVISNYKVDGRCEKIKRYWQVNRRDLNDGEPLDSLMPFGQDDMIYTFMEGIGENYLEYIKATMSSVLDHRTDSFVSEYVKDKDERTVERARQRKSNFVTMNEFMSEFEKYRNKSLIDPVTRVLSSLPKEDMAAMAEALVEITSLRRRVDSTMESVGGPVDVAVISKGDGFVWIKRKHYFPLEINPSFLKRKFPG